MGKQLFTIISLEFMSESLKAKRILEDNEIVVKKRVDARSSLMWHSSSS